MPRIFIGIKIKENELLKIGFPKEYRSFNPHLTFARIKKISDKTALESLITKYHQYKIHEFNTEEFIVFESILKKEQPVYKELKKIKLDPIAFHESR